METGTTKRKWRKVAWKKVEPLLLLAALAPSKEKRDVLMAAISARFDVAPRTLEDHLTWMGYKHVELQDGYAAIDRWEREMNALASVMEMRERLELAIFRRAVDLRNGLHRHQHRTVSVTEAARMLRVPLRLLNALIHDLSLLQLDGNGRVQLRELRRFYQQDGRWLIKSYRYMKKERLVR